MTRSTVRSTGRSTGRRGRRVARPGCPSRRAAGAAHHVPRRRPGGVVRRGRVDRRPPSRRGGEGGDRSAGAGRSVVVRTCSSPTPDFRESPCRSPSSANGIAVGPADSDGRVVVTAGGGVALPVLARRTAAASVTGFEWAVGVPGSVGGAVRMNAGGHGSDMAAALVDVDVFDLAAEVDRPADDVGARLSTPRSAATSACASAGPTSRTISSSSRSASISGVVIARPPSDRSPRSCAGAESINRAGRTADRCS